MKTKRRAKARARLSNKQSVSPQEGQSLVELTLMAPLLIMIVLAMMEVGFVMAVYISLVSGVREATSFASKYPQLTESSFYNSNYHGDTCTGNCITYGDAYISRVTSEVIQPFESLRGQGILTQNVDNSNVNPNVSTPVAPNGILPSNPITVTATYTVSTFLSTISLPYVGRFGLPPYYVLHYSYAMPIRGN